ncbi:hypothetical protein PXK30_03610 [Phaeobacter gallaeciensis]|uniref:hypothetical protein n=1 Tax=Phaeobacter gallaeciensis TaxID=60890 RepID=UPI00237F247E|nr:hypothetical protein [Phaeobacter gallaeciensis]MDE4303995.1 hypothetical protein [Phaeobacter gallaeciensis]MDE4309055.1 hypothetical protein [Phaeobacter gallaeciensis]MDE4313391.1 hypothetical protein [Phaeobacter gallaeciensis]MDE4317984.1 hypothetical protein [Phaeobacter gallaeciensis]MDE4322447.1 hypothetical protein [Phaeobacter gallaeciensis]
MTLKDFLEKVDRQRFQEATGFSAQLVSRAKKEGVFPAHWFWKVRKFCADNGAQVPEHLFRGHPEAVKEEAQ